MPEDNLTPRLVAALTAQCGQAVANVLELQIRNGDLVATVEHLQRYSQDQAERITKDADLIKVIRGERDKYREAAEAVPVKRRAKA